MSISTLTKKQRFNENYTKNVSMQRIYLLNINKFTKKKMESNIKIKKRITKKFNITVN